MNNDKIISKIKKLFALGTNNPSSEEAKTAVLKAQKLLSEYNISSLDLEEVEKEIAGSEIWEVGSGNKWKYRLGDLVARNFRCKCFWYGRDTVAFFGFETDRKIALDTFQYLYKVGHNLGKKCERDWRKRKGSANGVFNTYIHGFCEGVSSALDNQCQALMIVIPQKVEEEYKNMSKTFGKINSTILVRNDTTIYNKGFEDGKYILDRNSLKSGEVL